jgi:hypothetical protein
MTTYSLKDPNACKKIIELIGETLPAENADWLESDLIVSGSPDAVWYLNIDVCVSVAGILSILRTNGTDEWCEIQNAGVELTAGARYLFTIDVTGGDFLNVSYSATGGTIEKLRISEVV